MFLLSKPTYAELQDKYKDYERMQVALHPAREANALAHAADDRGDKETAANCFLRKHALLCRWLLLEGTSIQITGEELLIHYRIEIGLHFPERAFLSHVRDSSELSEKEKTILMRKYRKACRRAGK